MGYTIKQKIEICLKAESNPQMTQVDLATWAVEKYGGTKKPSQTTILRILSSKNDLIALKLTDFQLVRRRKQQNPLLRRILTEWITQSLWENIPITTPIIQLTANAIWTRLPSNEKDGNGIFNQKWCTHFVKKLNANLKGDQVDIALNPGGYPLNKVWQLDEKLELKNYLQLIILKEGYRPQDIFTIDEFQLFHNLPLDQIFDVLSIDKGLKQSSSSTENLLTIMLGTNVDGLEKLTPLVVGKNEKFDILKLLHPLLKSLNISGINLMNRITEVYNLYYKLNVNKWITLLMFQNYLLTLEHKLASSDPERKILIILDELSSHRIINIKFSNIRLCYLKGNMNTKNNLYLSQAGVKLDYLPMSFGIVEEFKILYRILQYLEMINIQNNRRIDRSGQAATLTELEYNVPLIRVFEWIKRLWELISSERILLLWKRTHLFPINPWPSTNPDSLFLNSDLQQLLVLAAKYNTNKSYEKLQEIMQYLNVVIPWTIDELLNLVNERGKVTLNYVSIEEIIGSCLLENEREDNRKANKEWLNRFDKDDYFTTAMNINGILSDGISTLPSIIGNGPDNALIPGQDNSITSTNGNSQINPISQLLTIENQQQQPPPQQEQPLLERPPGSGSTSSTIQPIITSVAPTSSGIANLLQPANSATLPDVVMEMSNTRGTPNAFLRRMASNLENENTNSYLSELPIISPNSSLVQITSNQRFMPAPGFPNKRRPPYTEETYSKDSELIKNLSKIIEARELNLSSSTISELQSNLALMQEKYSQRYQ